MLKLLANFRLPYENYSDAQYNYDLFSLISFGSLFIVMIAFTIIRRKKLEETRKLKNFRILSIILGIFFTIDIVTFISKWY